MRLHHKKLKAKGWSAAEIADAHAILDRAEQAKHPANNFLEKAVYGGLLFLTLIGIFLVSILIVPLLLVLPTGAIALILSVLGLCLGSLFAILIPDIEWLERRHHVLNVLIISLVAVVNVWFIVSSVDKIGRAMTLPYTHNSWLLGTLFAVALLIPYLVHVVMRR